MHKYLLEQHSDFFRRFLSDEDGSMGHSDERPIPLPENVTQQGFDTLLNFLYSGWVSICVSVLSDLMSEQDLRSYFRVSLGLGDTPPYLDSSPIYEGAAIRNPRAHHAPNIPCPHRCDPTG